MADDEDYEHYKNMNVNLLAQVGELAKEIISIKTRLYKLELETDRQHRKAVKHGSVKTD